MADSLIKQQLLDKQNTPESLTRDESRFLNALIRKDQFNDGEIDDLSEIEVKEIETFRPLFKKIGTPLESEILETLSPPPNEIMSTGEPVENRIMRTPTPAERARQIGTGTGLGILGDVESGRALDAVRKASDNIEPNPETGMPDFGKYMKNVERMIDEGRIEDVIKGLMTDPESFVEGEETGKTVAEELGIGTAAQIAGSFIAGKGLKKANFLTKGQKDIATGLAGSGSSGVAISASRGEGLPEMIHAGAMGMVLDTALMGVLKSTGKALSGANDLVARKIIEKLGNSVRKAGLEASYREFSSHKVGDIRAIEKKGGDIQQFAEVLLKEQVSSGPLLRDFWDAVPIFGSKDIAKRLATAIERNGPKLGALRDEVDSFGQKLKQKVDAVDINQIPEEQMFDRMYARSAVRNINLVDWHAIAERLHTIADKVPIGATKTDAGKVAKKLRGFADDLLLDRRYRNIGESVEYRARFRTPMGKMRAELDSVNVKAHQDAYLVMSDSLNKRVAETLTLKDLLKGDLSLKNIREVYFNNARTMTEAGEKISEFGAFQNAPEKVKDKFLKHFMNHKLLTKTYAVLNDADDILTEKFRKQDAYNKFSLVEWMMGGAGLAGGIIKGDLGSAALVTLGTMMTAKYLRNKGAALAGQMAIRAGTGLKTVASGPLRLEKMVNNLSLVASNVNIPKASLAGIPGITPGLFIALTHEQSPINLHGFMLIDDQKSLFAVTENIKKDKSFNSIEKAKWINAIKEEGFLKIFMNNREDVGKNRDFETSETIESFRDRLENIMPSFEDLPSLPTGRLP